MDSRPSLKPAHYQVKGKIGDLMAEESGKENQTSPTGEGAKKVESAAPVPPPSKRTNDGTNELASEGPAPAPAAAPNPRKTDTSDMMKVTRKAAPAGDAVTVGQMGVSMITKSRKESEQYGYMAEDASIMFHTYAGLGVMTTNFYPRIKDTLAYNLAYSAARVRVKPALEIMRDSSMPRRGLQMYLAERDLFFGEVRGILMMQVNGCRSHYGKAPSTNTWAMSQVTGGLRIRRARSRSSVRIQNRCFMTRYR